MTMNTSIKSSSVHLNILHGNSWSEHLRVAPCLPPGSPRLLTITFLGNFGIKDGTNTGGGNEGEMMVKCCFNAGQVIAM